MTSTKYHMPDHIKELRRQCLTGTDMAAISGYDPWRTLVDVWMEKKKKIEVNSFNERMEAGLRAEEMISEWYTDVTGIELVKTNFIQNGIYGGSPDRISRDNTRIIELKTAGVDKYHLWGDEGTDQVPMNYLIQTVWYMLLTETAKADIAVLIGGNDFRIYTIQKNEALEAKLKKLADRFWEKYVLGREIPPLTGSENVKAYLQESYKKGNGNVLEATPDIREKAEKLVALEEQIAELEEQAKTIRNQFRFIIGENEGIKGENLWIPWSTVKGAEYVEWEAVKEELNISEEVIKNHTKRKPDHRRLQVKVK